MRHTPAKVAVRFGLIFSVAASLIVVPAVGSGQPAHASSPARISMLGDSTMMYMNASQRAIAGEGYDWIWDADSCRRLVRPSCRGRYGYTPQSMLPLMRGRYNGQLGQALVVMAGYDDYTITTDVDAVMDEANAQGVAYVVWLTYRSNVTYNLPGGNIPAAPIYARHNATLRAAAAHHPNLVIADWDTHTWSRPDWFAWDGIHLSGTGAAELSRYINAQLDSLPLARCVAANATLGIAPPTSGSNAAAVTGGVTPISPVRVLDTRGTSLGGDGGSLGAGRVVEVALPDAIPEEATGVIATVTAVSPCAAGWLSVFDCRRQPATSNLNFWSGRTTAALVPTRIGPDRRICAYTSATTDVLIDITGYQSSGGDNVSLIGPIRIVDTRGGGASSITGTRTAASATAVTLRGVAGIGGGASGVFLNLTAVDPAQAGFLSVSPGPCTATPATSSLNVLAARTMAATAYTALGQDGDICIYTSTAAHVVVDVMGWTGNSGRRVRIGQPTRLLDTRIQTPGTDGIDSRQLALGQAAFLNVTATQPSGNGYVQVRPCGTGAESSLVNTNWREDTANLTVVKPGDAGKVCLGSSLATHIVVDQMAELVNG